MLRLELFDGNKTYMSPGGVLYTPEVIRSEFPAIDHFTHVLEVNGEVCQAVQNLSSLRNMFSIDPEMSNEEAITALEVILNTPPPIPEPSAEERIAAAMEFQNLMSL